ncbi:RNA-binding protein [Burkholderia stagnalis]
MAELLLVNVEEGAGDDEVGAFLKRHGFPLFDSIERVPAGIGNPIALLRFDTLSSVALYSLRERIDHISWKGRSIRAHILPHRMD